VPTDLLPQVSDRQLDKNGAGVHQEMLWPASKEGHAMSLRLLRTLSGGLEILAGLPALISPAPVVSLLLGVPVGQLAAVLARFFGAGVFALGLVCLKARDDVGSADGLVVVLGITAYNALAAMVLL
jgi:hypothetical protein